MSDLERAACVSLLLPTPADPSALPPASLKAAGWEAVDLDATAADVPAEARAELRGMLRAAGLPVAAIVSQADGDWRLERLRAACQMARYFEAQGVVTSAPPADTPEAQLTEWLTGLTRLAEAEQMEIWLENRPGTLADRGARLGSLVSRAGSPWIGMAFDPAGFVAVGEHPFLTAFLPSPAKAHLRRLRVADATFPDGAPAPLNGGSAEIKELVSAVLARCFDGCFAVDLPERRTGPDEARAALEEFHRLLDSL